MCVARVSCLLLVISTSATALAQTPGAGSPPAASSAAAPSAAPPPASPAPPAPSAAPPPASPAPGAPSTASPQGSAPAYPYAPPPAYPPPAYPQPYPYAPAYSPPPPPPPPPNPAHERRIGNAHADRVLLAPTAYTHPAGSFYATSYDIALLQIGYALSDSTQISLTGTPVIGNDTAVPLDLSLKTRLLDERRVRIAVIASATGIVGLNQGDFFLGRGGGVVQLCFDDACKGSFSLGSTLLLAGSSSLVASGAGAIVPVTHWLHLLLEADSLLPIGREAGPYNGVAVGAGARFPFRSWAIDVGVLRALGTTSSSATVPLLAITYRYVP